MAEVEQSGWTRTAPAEGSYSVELVDADATGKDFGNHGSFSISGTSFVDTNGNGAKDGDETGQADRSLQLSQNGNVVNATSTGQDGSYAFHNLAPGTYTISEVAIEGWVQTVPQGSYTVELTNADVTGKDFGSRGNLSISGQKYYDINGNGVQDADEPGIPGGSVSLVENGKVVANTTTDDNGLYSFKNVLPGTYTINDPVPGGLILTTSSTVTVTVTTTVVVNANFGIVGPYSISGVKYNDLNNDKSKEFGRAGCVWMGHGLDRNYLVWQAASRSHHDYGCRRNLQVREAPAGHLQGQRDLKDRLDPDRSVERKLHHIIPLRQPLHRNRRTTTLEIERKLRPSQE